MVQTKIIRGKTYKYGSEYTSKKIAQFRAKAVRRQGFNATILKENGRYIMWIRPKILRK